MSYVRPWVVEPSSRVTKKWSVKTPSGRIINFGAVGYEDYTMHGDATRAEDYVRRHAAREDWSDPETAGFWSRWLLWEKPTIKAALAALRRRLGATIIFKNRRSSSPYR